jgi:prepilin-type N-terminal cleavage/methylation domain-containing protein
MQNPSLPLPETKQKGYTIIELGIALAIIAVLIVAGLAGVTTVLNSSKANAQIEDSGIVLAKLQSILSSTSTSSMTTAAGIGSSLFPSSRVNAAATAVTNKFGGSEFVASNSAALSQGTHGAVLAEKVGVIYVMTSVPKTACADIANSLASLASAAWIHAASVSSDTDAASNTNLTTANLVKSPGGTVDGAAVGTRCNATPTPTLAFLMRP